MTTLEVNQAIIADWRAKVRAGQELTEEELTAAIATLRRARTAAPEAKARTRKATAAETKVLDDSVFD